MNQRQEISVIPRPLSVALGLDGRVGSCGADGSVYLLTREGGEHRMSWFYHGRWSPLSKEEPTDRLLISRTEEGLHCPSTIKKTRSRGHFPTMTDRLSLPMCVSQLFRTKK